MIAYAAKRILGIALIIAVISVLIFAVTQLLPGNVAYVIAGQFASPETIAAIEAKLGLNAPAYQQYWHWASRFITGDLGQSLIMERPVAPLVFAAAKASALLAGVAFIVVALIGVTLGVFCAIRANTLVDHLGSIFAYIGISVPEFFWGIVLVMFFSLYLGWLPADGVVPTGAGFVQGAIHLILPAATLALTLVAHVSRLTRSSMLEALDSNYVRNARARGLSSRVVIVRYALRNALIPTVTILAIDVGWLIGGIVVVEAVFSYPGLGSLLVYSIERHDLPLIQAILLLIAVVYCVSNLIADLLYGFLNPKIRYGRTG
jgi:peptide/nickel transport system permease protein